MPLKIAFMTMTAIALSGCVAATDAPHAAAASPTAASVASRTEAPHPAPPTIRAPQLADFQIVGSAKQGGALRGVLPQGVASATIDGVPLSVAADRRWLYGFDRDAPNVVVLKSILHGGREAHFEIAVATGDWRIERVNIPIRGASKGSEDFQRRRAAELAQIAAARAVVVESDGWRQSFRWPVTGRFSGFFGSQRIYQGVAASYHSGTDIAVPRGTPFYAPADGVVVLAAQAPFTLEGNLLIVSHGAGLNSAFLHCDTLEVTVGDVVQQGMRLGTVGSTGRSTGPHMHWGMKWNEARVDPGAFVQ